jgi:hypothetical protein
VSIFLTILMWAGIVVGALVALAIVLFVVYMVWTMFTGATPEGVEFDVSSPALVGEGEPFTMTVSVRNLLDKARKFHSLDFDNSLLGGFVVEKLAPTSKESSSAYGSTAHHYELTIEPRGSLLFTLTCRALSPGDYSGDVVVFVDSKSLKSVSKVWRLVVR